MEYPFSKKHIPMSIYDRAAQFAPFSALVGLDDELSETARLTDCKLELTEDKAAELNEKMRILTENAAERPQISVEYFIPDENKSGGAYVTETGCFRRVDESNNTIVFTDGRVIAIRDIYEIFGELLNGLM
jgi:hypothetical protein